MIDMRLLYKLNCRLRAICAKLDRFFDDMNILLCDDFAQLSSVDDTLMCSHFRHFNSKLLIAQTIYRAFDQFVFLTRSMRQNEDSSTVRNFRETLIEMRDESISLINWQFLQSRSRERLISQEWAKFTHALRLYARNIDFVKYNLNALKRLNCSMLKINVNHQEKEASEKSNENAEKLNKKLFIFIDSRVMLIWNMWIEKKLINDVMSAVRDIFWDDHVDNSLNHMSTMLLIQFDDYNESTSSKVNDVNVISVILKINQWKNDDMICSRTQFSLISIFAISIHKNQRLTLSLMMLSFRRFDDCSRQSYVALSRVKSIEHVAFESKFSFDHFSKRISKIVMRRIQNARTKQELEIQINVLNVLENMNSS